jgi:lipopolysaccharide export system protein LptC
MLGIGETAAARMLSWTKIVLPMASLAILSSLFLFSKSHAPVEGIPTFSGDLDEFVSKERITGPRFTGMTASGISLVIRADEAGPKALGGKTFEAQAMAAIVETPNGGRVDIRAALGVIDPVSMTAKLTDGITLVTSSGYTARTQGLVFALDHLDIRSEGEILANGPLGEIHAGQMNIHGETLDGEDGEVGYAMIFKNGTKLIYKPQ